MTEKTAEKTVETVAGVDYPELRSTRSAKAARENLAQSQAIFRDFVATTEAETEGKTALMAHAVWQADKHGLIVDGRGEVPDGSTTLKAIADGAGTVKSQATYWRSLAHALRCGVKPGQGVWNVLAGHPKRAKAGKVGPMLANCKTVADILKGLESLGIDPVTGVQSRTANPDPGKGDGSSDGTDTGSEEREAARLAARKPLDVFAEGLATLEAAFAMPGFGPDEWTKAKADITRVMAAQTRKREGKGTRKARNRASAPDAPKVIGSAVGTTVPTSATA